MKTSRLLTTSLLLLLIVAFAAEAQIDYTLRTQGRIRVEDPTGGIMIERYNLNLAVANDLVYDRNDMYTGAEVPVDPPVWADDEREAPVDILDPALYTMVMTGHRWDSHPGFIIFRYDITNPTGDDLTAWMSLEQVPRILGAYAGEAVFVDDSRTMSYCYKTGQYVGTRLLSEEQWSFVTISYSEYSVGDIDSLRFTNASTPTSTPLDEPFTDHDGVVNYINAGQHTVQAGETWSLYFAVAYGTEFDEMQAAMDKAVAVYALKDNDVHFAMMNEVDEVGPDGGTVEYDVSFATNFNLTQSGSYWTMVEAPNGQTYGPTVFVNFVHTPYMNQTAYGLLQPVPAFAPAGEYIVHGNIGYHPNAIFTAGFDFLKTGVMGASQQQDPAVWHGDGSALQATWPTQER